MAVPRETLSQDENERVDANADNHLIRLPLTSTVEGVVKEYNQPPLVQIGTTEKK